MGARKLNVVEPEIQDGSPKPGTLVYAKPEWFDPFEALPPLDKPIDSAMVVLGPEDGGVVATWLRPAPDAFDGAGSRRKIVVFTHEMGEWYPTQATAIRAEAAEHREVAAKYAALADRLDAIADRMEGRDDA